MPAASASRGRSPGIHPSQYVTARRMVAAALPQENSSRRLASPSSTSSARATPAIAGRTASNSSR
jgi:hypothetical protein